MNKKEYIKNLKKVKVVLGNGFDLHCGLHTTYSDYYCKNYKRYLFIQNLYLKYEETSELHLDFSDKKISGLNAWDIFFALNSSKNPKECRKRWCDVEKMMLSSFVDSEATELSELVTRLLSKINWNIIKECVIDNRQPLNHLDGFIVTFCKGKMELKGARSGFYSFLLDELKEFERNFGNFIYYELHNNWLEKCNPWQQFFNTTYIEKAIDTLDELCGKENLVGIDSFNYSYIHTEKMINSIQHINGSLENPIFGLDTIFEPKDERFLFTKTSRRIDSDMFYEAVDLKPDFDNLVIFGHSLDEADYSYFFPIFDRLHLTDTIASNTVVFAYTIYDADREAEIKSTLRQSIANILYAYAISKNLPDPKRFLDSLSTQKRIITYEIPQLNRNNYPRSSIDKEWQDLYKEIDELKL